MVNGLFFCDTLTGHRGSHTQLYSEELKRTTPVRRRLSRTRALLGRAIAGRKGTGVWNKNAESCRVGRPLCIPLVIRSLPRTYVVVVRKTDELLCSG